MMAFKTKNAVLKKVATGRLPDDLPRRLSPLWFCGWQAPAHDVKRISTFIFYSKKDKDYEKERGAALAGIAALDRRRKAKLAKQASKNPTVGDLKQQLKEERARAKSFANQYSAQARLVSKLTERVEELEQRLARANRDLSQVRPLRSVKASGRGAMK